MNPYEESIQMLRKCPIPHCIQQLIYYLLIGYGTSHANAIQTMPAIEDVPRKIIKFGTFDSSNRCDYTLCFTKKTITYNYDNSTYSSLRALYENHLIYMNKRQHPQIQQMENKLNVLIKNKLMCLMVEENAFKRVFKNL